MNFSLLRTQADLTDWREQQGCEVGFVPTMGSLHAGHGELIKTASKSEGAKRQKVIVSIFVNPLQFGPKEDFLTYPRDLDSDIQFSKAFGANAIWIPSIEEIFPEGPENQCSLKAPNNLKKHLCGSTRKGHFDGVCTIMFKLLKLIKPNSVVLGEKDWQQLIIIKRLIVDFGMDINVKSVRTIRDFDGLALSSRNRYLNKEERIKSSALPRILKQASTNLLENQVLNLNQIKIELEKSGLEVEYIEQVNPWTLQPIRASKKISLLAAAVYCGQTRLIDHAFLMTNKPIVAIDGPAGAGKSTVTKGIAKRLGLVYLDTGAMYRAVTWFLLEKNIDLNKELDLVDALEKINLEIESDSNDQQRVKVNGYDVTGLIRSPEVTSKVSKIATFEPVRKLLTDQQKIIGRKGGIVAEGRDIGTTVFPNAELKIFLTASPMERAKRRFLDLEKQGFKTPDLKELECQIKERDKTDQERKLSPLLKAEDAIEIVTDGLNIDEVINKIVSLFQNKIPEEVWRESIN